jgi:Zn-dependent peptidase ImmA (M78 family)
MNFKQFLESEDNDVETTLKKLPKKVQSLLKGYKFKFTDGSCLKNDNEHIGIVDKDKKTITIAAGWNYSRCFTLLHEIGHLIWSELINNNQKNKWDKIVKKTKEKQNQNPEELFCMSFANYFVKMKLEIHTHDTWEEFMKSIFTS